MNLDKYLVVAGVPGVHKLVASRSNGLLIEDLNEGRTRFVAARQGQISPLASMAIFTDTEEGTVPLAEVFQKMLDQVAETPPPLLIESSDAFRQYFSIILPEHDRDQVHINDIKKCVKWFNFMKGKGIFEEIKREADASAQAETVAENTQAAAPETAEASAPEEKLDA